MYIHVLFGTKYIAVTRGLEVTIRQVFKSWIWKNWPSPLDIWTFKGHIEVSISNGSGIRDPRFGVLRIEITRADRTHHAAWGWQPHRPCRGAAGDTPTTTTTTTTATTATTTDNHHNDNNNNDDNHKAGAEGEKAPEVVRLEEDRREDETNDTE